MDVQDFRLEVSAMQPPREVTPTSLGVSATRLLSAARLLSKATTTLCTALERFPSSDGLLTPAFCALSLCTFEMNRLHFLLQTRVFFFFFPPHISIKSSLPLLHTHRVVTVCVCVEGRVAGLIVFLNLSECGSITVTVITEPSVDGHPGACSLRAPRNDHKHT